MRSGTSRTKVTLLAGGVGAARLLCGLVDVVDPIDLTVIVNTGDDEEFYGLHVSPDLDTIVYTLAGMAPEGRGWGIRGDSFNALGALAGLYGDAWFQLGDRDLATNLFRTDGLRRGWSLSRCTREIARALGVHVKVLPATDDRVRTRVHTRDGVLAFQEYLVRRRACPRVERIRYEGAARARPAPGVLSAIRRADVVLLAPSNPFVSIGPILAVRGVREALRDVAPRVVAVSPLIRGRAVKGPLASMLRTLGYRVGSDALLELYRGLIGTLIVAPGDAPGRPARSMPRIVEHDILITRRAAARRLARFALEHARAA